MSNRSITPLLHLVHVLKKTPIYNPELLMLIYDYYKEYPREKYDFYISIVNNSIDCLFTNESCMERFLIPIIRTQKYTRGHWVYNIWCYTNSIIKDTRDAGKKISINISVDCDVFDYMTKPFINVGSDELNTIDFYLKKIHLQTIKVFDLSGIENKIFPVLKNTNWVLAFNKEYDVCSIKQYSDMDRWQQKRWNRLVYSIKSYIILSTGC